MTEALRRLLENFIDYAGLFPPAQLPMKEAVDNYLSYINGAESEFVSRFVCSSSRLDELRGVLANIDIAEPIGLSIIGTVSTSQAAWGDALIADAEAMTRFMERVGDAAELEAFEIRIPDHKNLPEYLKDLNAFNQVDVFCELPWDPAMFDSLGLIAEQDWIGAKARVGGLDAKAFPSSEEVAQFLQLSAQLDLMYKLTAGLHHPLRSHQSEVGTKMHGFLNIFTAAALLQAHDLTKNEVEEILDSEDLKDFTFDEEKVAFKDVEADLDAIEDARSILAGIGSCSVEEPLSELKALQLD